MTAGRRNPVVRNPVVGNPLVGNPVVRNPVVRNKALAAGAAGWLEDARLLRSGPARDALLIDGSAARWTSWVCRSADGTRS
jgi:hypothetical protein